MRETVVKISYDPESDLLEVQFARIPGARTGIGLNDQITLFFDETLEHPLGLTATSYTKLLLLEKLPLNELQEAPDEIQKKVRHALQLQPLIRFLHLEGESAVLDDRRISELVSS